MTKIGEAVKLPLPVSDKVQYQIEGNYKYNNVILTAFPKTVLLYNLQCQQIVKEWSLKGSRKFTSAAIAVPSSKMFTAVIDRQTVRNWHEDDVEIDTSKKVTLPKFAYKLFRGKRTNYILYTDGSCSNILKGHERIEIGNGIVSDNEEITWASFCSCGEEENHFEYILYVIKKKSSDDNFRVCEYKLGETDSKYYEYPVSSADSNARCESFCLHHREKNVYLYMLWSNGVLCRKNITDGNSSIETISTIPDIDPNLASIHAIDHTQILISGIRRKAVDSKSKNTVGVGIWATNFNILQAYQSLPNEEYSHMKVYCLNQKILVHTDRAIYMLPLECERTTLSAVLGKFGPTIRNVSEIQHNVCKLLESNDENSLLLVTSYVPGLIDKWVEESPRNPKFNIPSDLIRKLVNKNFIGSRELQKLMPLLTKYTLIDVIYKCLCSVKGIAESTIIHCVAFFLSCENNKLIEAVDCLTLSKSLCEEDGSSGIDKYRAVFLKLILTLPYNDVFLLENLQYLPFEHVLLLVNYLYDILIATVGGIKISNVETEVPNPILLQVVDWISILFDAHSTQIILSQDARALLVKLHEAVQSKMDFFDELNQLDALLIRLQESHRHPSSSNKDIGSYCIEVLHF